LALVFVVAVGLFIAVKPKHKRQPETTADAADRMEWTLTRRIDLADPESVGTFVVEVEETRISTSPTASNTAKGNAPEAKMVLESYHAQQNLSMSATFPATAPAGMTRNENGQAESLEPELKEMGNGQEMTDVTLVPREVSS
jgi:hypothetical protein